MNEVYLVQHGEARPESEDPARPLTERGREEVGRVARAARRQGLEVALVGHSGKLRAQQTAEILAAELRPAEGVREMAGLGPNDDPAVAARALEEAGQPWLLVGHLPHLGRLTSLLVVGDPARALVAFRMGGIVCLGRESEGWRLRWILRPEIVPE